MRNMVKDFKYAFTLSEVLITLVLVGIIASILLPALIQNKPDKNKVLFKKAYTTVENIVTELVNDDRLYPLANGTEGLDNTTSVTVNDTSYSGNTKFCKLFALKLNTIETDDAIQCGADNVAFTTSDSIQWYMPETAFAADAKIKVDVNGSKEPNCEYNTTSCDEPDQFAIYVSPDGSVGVKGVKEKEYLRSSEVTKTR